MWENEPDPWKAHCPQWWVVNTRSIVKSEHSYSSQALHIAIPSSVLMSNSLWWLLKIHLFHKTAWWGCLRNWVLKWNEKSKKWKQNCITEILEYFMLGPPLRDISSLGNILCFSLSGRLQQSWGQREPYSWWLTWVALLAVPEVLLPLCLTPKHLCKHNCFPLTSTFFRASLHETLRYAWRLDNVLLSGDNWQQQLTAQLPQPTTCAGVF